MHLRALLALFMILVPAVAFAVAPDEILKDPVLNRARAAYRRTSVSRLPEPVY